MSHEDEREPSYFNNITVLCLWIPIYVNLHKSKVNIWICQLNWDNSPPLKLCTLNSNKKSFMADKVLNVFTPNQICRISSTHIFNSFHPCICLKIVHCIYLEFIFQHLSGVQSMHPTAWGVPISLPVLQVFFLLSYSICSIGFWLFDQTMHMYRLYCLKVVQYPSAGVTPRQKYTIY